MISIDDGGRLSGIRTLNGFESDDTFHFQTKSDVRDNISKVGGLTKKGKNGFFYCFKDESGFFVGKRLKEWRKISFLRCADLEEFMKWVGKELPKIK